MEVVHFDKEAKQIFKKASINLRDWMPNDESVIERIPHNDEANQDPMKFLGLVWLIYDDMLSLSKIMAIQKEPTLTKIIVLKQIVSVFDPLGLFSPVILQGKLLLQTLWNKNIS